MSANGSTDAVRITLWAGEISKQIEDLPLAELPPEVEEWRVYFSGEGEIDALSAASVSPRLGYVEYIFEFNLDDWKGLWSAREYGDEMARVIEKRATPEVTIERVDEEAITDGFNIRFKVELPAHVILADAIDCRLDELHRIYHEAKARLEASATSDAIVLRFDFPKPVKAACEQYLLYFGEFLRDVGVNAETELREVAGKVLFQVRPTDKTEALSTIHEA